MEDFVEICHGSANREDVRLILDWLEFELHFVTRQDSSQEEQKSVIHYELTHDFLVTLIRKWLARRQRETMRGRAMILLEERTRWWQESPTSRQLPSFLEWLNIRAFCRRRERSDSQNRLLKATDRLYLVRSSVVLCFAALAIGLFSHLYFQMQAEGLVDRLMTAEVEKVPGIVAESQFVSARVNSILMPTLNQPELTKKVELRTRMQLVSHDASQLERLFQLARNSTHEEIGAVSKVVKTYRKTDEIDRAMEPLWKVIDDQNASEHDKLRSAAFLANLDSSDLRWDGLKSRWVDWFVAEPPHLTPHWTRLFRPVAAQARAQFLSFIENKNQVNPRQSALHAYLSFEADHLDQLVKCVPYLTPQELPLIVDLLRSFEQSAEPALHLELKQWPSDIENAPDTKGLGDERAHDEVALRASNVILTMALLGNTSPFIENLAYCSNPRVRTYLIHDVLQSQISRDKIWKLLDLWTPTPSTGNKALSPGACSALLIALGERVTSGNGSTLTPQQLARLETFFEDHPDPGVHSAAEWLLRELGHEATVMQLKRKNCSNAPMGNRRWFILPIGLTFAVIEPGRFTMGGPSWVKFPKSEPKHQRVIPRRFAISTTMISREQYDRMMGLEIIETGTSDNHPAVNVSVDDAMRFCLRLSGEIGLPKEEDCFVPADWSSKNEARGTMVRHPNALERHGFRFPTEGEYEYACRAGTNSFRHTGYAPELLSYYAWYAENSAGHVHPVGLLCPNPWGLFDCLGNVFEMCQDTRHIEAGGNEIIDRAGVADDQGNLVLRGTAYSSSGDSNSSHYWISGSNSPDKILGFRVVQTLP